MKCARCNRPINKAAATIPTRGGVLAFGPKCAGAAGFVVVRERKARQAAFPKAARPAPVAPDQIALELTV